MPAALHRQISAMGKAAAFRSPLAAVVAVLLFALCSALADDDTAELQSALQHKDAQLNQVYQAIRQNLGTSGQSSLKATQRAWIAFKEKDFAIYASLARMANDPARAYAYEAAETEARTWALNSLGKPGDQWSGDDANKTATEADQMLNSAYRRCIGMLPPEKAQEVKETEALWIAFRDMHCQFDAAFKGGQPDDAVLRNLTMRRANQLAFYLNLMLRAQLPAPDDWDLGNPGEDQSGSPPADVYRFAR